MKILVLGGIREKLKLLNSNIYYFNQLNIAHKIRQTKQKTKLDYFNIALARQQQQTIKYFMFQLKTPPYNPFIK